MKRLPIVLLLCLLAFGVFAANPPYEAFLGTNGILVKSNPPNGKILIDGSRITNGSSPVFVTTNLFVVNNTFTSNLFVTNITVNQTLITSNLFTTNLTVQSITVLQTLFAISNIFVSNIFVTNIVVNNINVNSNLFVTNAFFSGITTNSGTISGRVLTLPTTAGLGWFEGTNQWYVTNLTGNLTVLLTNLMEGADYYLQVSNPASFTVTFTSIGNESWIEHPYVAGAATTNGITLFHFQRWGTKTNAFEHGRELTLTNDDGTITFQTNRDTLVIRSVGSGGVGFASLVWTNNTGTLYPIAYPTNVILAPTNTGSVSALAHTTNFLFQTSTRRIGGTNTLFAVMNGGASAFVVGDQGIMIGSTNYITVPQMAIDIAYDTAFGVDTPVKGIVMTSYNSVVGYSGTTEFNVSTNYGRMILTANKEGNGQIQMTEQVGGDASFINYDLSLVVVNPANTIIVPYQIDPDFSMSPTGYIFGSTMRITNIHTLMSLQNSNMPVFEVNGIGDLKLLKRVAYSWPSAQGAAQTVLTNDGAGNLGWGAVSGTGGSGDQVWTNELGLIHPISTNAIGIYQNGGIQIGTNTTAVIGETVGASFNGVFYAARDTSKGENDGTGINLTTTDGSNRAFIQAVASISDGSKIDIDWDDVGNVNHNWILPLADSDGPHITAAWSNDFVLSIEPKAIFGAMFVLDNLKAPNDFILLQSNSTPVFRVDAIGDIIKIRRITYSWPSAQGAAATVLTNNGSGVLGWGTVAAVNPLAGTTNILNLSVQAAKLPATNYPAIDAGWQAWETVYAETNAEGARIATSAIWQFVVPPDYATNSLKLLINYSLSSTNGPNTSNVVFGVSVLPIRSGTTNNVHTNFFGAVVRGSNDWIAKYDGTNIVTNLVIDLGVNSLLMPRDVGLIKLQRLPTEDTYDGAVAVHGLQLEYTRP